MPLDSSYPHLICSRLIADVVTGKLDMREVAANLPDVNLEGRQSLADGGEVDDQNPAGSLVS